MKDILTFPGTDSQSSEFLCKAALWIHSDLLGTWNSLSSNFSAKTIMANWLMVTTIRHIYQRFHLSPFLSHILLDGKSHFITES